MRSRQGVNIAEPELVNRRYLFDEHHLLWLIEAIVPGVNALSWSKSHLTEIKQQLSLSGGVLLRGFTLGSLEEFKQLMLLLGTEIMEYKYRSTPRIKVDDGIYTATEYPACQTIPQHNEMSYARSWPEKIGFLCRQPALYGGETPICDSRQVFQGINPAVVQEFIQRGVMYVRNYEKTDQQGLGLSWQETFQVDYQTQVEAMCDAMQLEWTWHGERLTTRQVCQAMVKHPKTGESCWFNQAHLFHVSNLDPILRDTLLSTQSEDSLSRNAYYGDGGVIEDQTLDHIRAIYQQKTLSFPWLQDDILLLDNVLTTHGRMPFEGTRKVLVSMV